MKKLLITSILIFGAAISHAVTPAVFRSSNTVTIDTARGLCTQGGATRHAVLHTACVNTGTAGTLTLYNTFGTAASPIAAIDTAAKGCQTYDVITSSGLSYANSAAANITISYECF